MNRRQLLALLGLVAVALLAGCGFGPTDVPDEELNQNVSFDWDTDANATYSLSRSSYSAVVQVSNQSSLKVFRRDALGTDNPIRPNALRFRFPNGTVVNASHTNLSATLRSSSTLLKLPADNGTIGYTAGRSGKRFSTPVFVDGSHELVLPAGTRVGVPLLSQVSPGGYQTKVGQDNRMTIRWDDLDGGAITARYYLQRDLLLFTILLVVVVFVGGGGLIYYVRQLRRLQARREEMALDVEEESEEKDPPPGMG